MVPPQPLPIDPHELRALIAQFQTRIKATARQRRHRERRGIRCEARWRPSRPPERLGELILLLCTRLADHRSWRGYSYKQDLIGLACIDCLRAAAKFDLSRTTNGRPCSVFSYLTMTAWRAFVKGVKAEHKRGFRAPDGCRVDVEAMPQLILGNFPGGAPEGRLPARRAFHRPEA